LSRLIIILIVISLLFYFVYSFKRKQPEKQKQIKKHLLTVIVVVVFSALVLSGHLNWLFALVAAIIPMLPRFFSLASRYMPFVFAALKKDRPHREQENNKEYSRQGFKSGAMSVEEARGVLALKEKATREEIIQAHRKLMQKMHPDRGGSDYLAAKINQAKEVLLSKLS